MKKKPSKGPRRDKSKKPPSKDSMDALVPTKLTEGQVDERRECRPHHDLEQGTVGLGRARSRCRLRPRVQEGRDVQVPLHDPSHLDARQDRCELNPADPTRKQMAQLGDSACDRTEAWWTSTCSSRYPFGHIR